MPETHAVEPQSTSHALVDDITAQAEESSGYSRVTADKALAIKQLRKIGKTGQEIAAAIGMHPSTVSRWLRLLETDTVQEARQLSKSQALRATLKLTDQVDHADPRVSQGAAKALVALAGVQETSAQVQVGVQVIVGNSTQPAGPDPFEAIAASVVEPQNG